jgi:hypothetical protein
MVRLIIYIYLMIGFCLSVYGITAWMISGKHREEKRLSVLIPAFTVAVIAITFLWPIIIMDALWSNKRCR